MIQSKYSNRVTEIQGIYGPLQVLENQVQQIWAWQHLQPGIWKTNSGSRLKVLDAGNWNRGSGPDFKEAIIELDGQRRVGDVEIHLYREDWWRHGHDSDPAYNDVILHVVLFAGGMSREITTQNGRSLEQWNMGSYVREDIESISGGIPGLFGEHVPELREWIESDEPEEIREKLMLGADRRFQAKISMSRCLLDSFGFEDGLHRMVLYYFGFPYNRRPFYEMADAYPAKFWQSPEMIKILRERWQDTVRWKSGRPANRAESRLHQYVRLNALGHGWMLDLRKPPAHLLKRFADNNPGGWLKQPTPWIRRQVCLSQWMQWLYQDVLRGLLNPGLNQRLWVDVFLPVLVSYEILSPEDAVGLWFHSLPANYPPAYRDILKLIIIQCRRNMPLCNGWIQGLLWLEDQLRLERVRSALG